MNLPLGSFDYLDGFSGYDPGWSSDPSTDGDFDTNHYGLPSFQDGSLEPYSPSSMWTSVPTPLTFSAPGIWPHGFMPEQQLELWSVLGTQLDRPTLPTRLDLTEGCQNTDLTGLYGNEATAIATPPPPEYTGMNTERCCRLPRNTTAELSCRPEDAQALFASPKLPRKDPPCLYDDNHQPLQKQNPRWENDLYAALWIRGEGVSREGWCGFCLTWYKLKDSAYWYHMHYTHGIACHSGRPLDPPRGLRWSHEAKAYEALCSECNEWTPIGKGDRLRTSYWRHAYKCSIKGMGKGQVRSPRRATAGFPND